MNPRHLLALLPLAIVLSMPGAAQAAPQTIDADDLERGATTSVAHLVGTTLRTGAGKSFELPATEGDYHLLGKSRAGWVIWEKGAFSGTGQEHNLLLLKDGKTSTFYSRTAPVVDDDSTHATYLLSDSTKRVAQVFRRAEAPTQVTVVNLSGEKVASRFFDDTSDVLDFPGPRMILGDHRVVRTWRPGHRPTVTAKREANYADTARDQVSLRGKKGRFGFTTLSRPGRLRWSARFDPMRISPDGRRVYGLKLGVKGDSRRDVLQVRRMRDGKLIASFRTRFLRQTAAIASTWEGSKAVVFLADLSGDKGAVLVRCRVKGACVRASDNGYPITVPFQPDRG